tara:strand:- start:136 stop:636 length:501 start_codon:yes stop_codon:yes gene_type:complete
MEALGINLAQLITQTVGFLVLLWLLSKFLYRPVLNVLDDRSARIKESLDSAEKAKEEAAETQAKIEKQILEAREEGQARIAEAQQMAERFREEQMAKAQEEIVAERERAEAEIQRERVAAIEELRREFASLAINAAERVVDRSLDSGAHQEVIEKVLEESTSIKRS